MNQVDFGAFLGQKHFHLGFLQVRQPFLNHIHAIKGCRDQNFIRNMGGLLIKLLNERSDQFGIGCQGFREMKISRPHQMPGPDKENRHNHIRR